MKITRCLLHCGTIVRPSQHYGTMAVVTQHSWATHTKQSRLYCKHPRIYYAHKQVLAHVYGAMEKRIFRADCCYQNSSESLLLLCLRALTTRSGNCMQMDEMFWCSARSGLPLFIWDPDSHLHSNGWMDASHTMKMPFYHVLTMYFLHVMLQEVARSSWNTAAESRLQLTNSPSSSFPTGQGKPCWWYYLRHPKASDSLQLSEKQF